MGILGREGTAVVYKRIFPIAMEFKRAYGRNATIILCEYSPERFQNFVLKFLHAALKSSEHFRPRFFVNGIKVFEGVPRNFSELDESIDIVFTERAKRRDSKKRVPNPGYA